MLKDYTNKINKKESNKMKNIIYNWLVYCIKNMIQIVIVLYALNNGQILVKIFMIILMINRLKNIMNLIKSSQASTIKHNSDIITIFLRVKLILHIILYKLHIIVLKMMKSDASASKRIVINNAKKSMMINRPAYNTDMKNSISSPRDGPKKLANSFGPESIWEQKDKQHNERLKKLTEQLNFFKAKNDQSLITVRFLTEKLQSYGGMSSLPQNIAKQISQTDKRIKQLQQLLYFKRSKQMKKLKKRIRKFLTILQYDITDQDLTKIDDQVEMILFLIDIFSDKFNELMNQKNQIDALVENLRQDTVFNRNTLEQQLELMKIQKERLNKYLRDMQMELIEYRRQGGKNSLNGQSLKNQKYQTNSYINNQRNHELQLQKQNLKIDLEKQRNMNRSLEYQISMLKRRNQENQSIIASQKLKIISVKDELQTAQNQQNKWRERYRIMQQQKDERIKILQAQKYEGLVVNDSSSKNLLHTDQSYGRISFGKRNNTQQAEEQFFDLK